MWRGEKAAGPWQTMCLFFPAGGDSGAIAAACGSAARRSRAQMQARRGRGRSDISSGDRANDAQLQPVRRVGPDRPLASDRNRNDGMGQVPAQCEACPGDRRRAGCEGGI